MEKATTRSSRQCPQCGVRLTRYEWSRLWWMSSGMSGKLVQPCQECGTKLRLSSMALVSAVAALGLIILAVTYIFYPASILLFIALGLINWGALKLAANQVPWLIFLAPSLFATLGMALLGLPLSFARSWWPVILCWLLHGGLLLLTTVLAASAAGGRWMVAASLA